MSNAVVRTFSPIIARRLAITCQLLTKQDLTPDAAGILSVLRRLGCLQLDPTNIVARSHLLVLWSRLGTYAPASLDTLLWHDRSCFEYWAHAASIVLTEDYPIHNLMMRHYSAGDSSWDVRVRTWVAENHALRSYILAELDQRGPLASRDFEDRSVSNWRSSGWSQGRNVSRMLDFLWAMGEITVAGRASGQKLWDTSARCLPDWTPREVLDERAVVRSAVQRSLRALGVAQSAHIREYFIRGRYPDLEIVLDELEAEGQIVRVAIADDSQTWAGSWYMHADDLALLDRLTADEWAPRTTLLSPFDNMIADRKRTEKIFNFSFRLELYTPRSQRKYGYYVLPILHGDQLIGRIDAAFDRKGRRLLINALYTEPDLAGDAAATAPAAVGLAVHDLARFLGATDVVVGEQLPLVWQQGLNQPIKLS